MHYEQFLEKKIYNATPSAGLRERMINSSKGNSPDLHQERFSLAETSASEFQGAQA